MPESKDVLKKTGGLDHVNGTQEPTCERAPKGQSQNILSKKVDNVVLYYNQKYKIHLCEYKLIEIND